MILGYDTETSGLPHFHDPSDAPHQPHLMQLAMILFDMEGREVARWANLVKPGLDCVMAPEAFAAHGITLERARDEGVEPTVALDAFLEMVATAHLMVGHNESFDRRIMRIHSARHRGEKWAPPIPSFCTLYKSKFIIKLPPTPKMVAAGMRTFKSPNLGECIQHFFNEPLLNAHDALADVEACMRVFWHLVRNHNVPMFKPGMDPASRAAAAVAA